MLRESEWLITKSWQSFNIVYIPGEKLQGKIFPQVDYFARARRLEEVPLLQKEHEENSIKAREFWEQQELERVSESSALSRHPGKSVYCM